MEKINSEVHQDEPPSWYLQNSETKTKKKTLFVELIISDQCPQVKK